MPTSSSPGRQRRRGRSSSPGRRSAKGKEGGPRASGKAPGAPARSSPGLASPWAENAKLVLGACIVAACAPFVLLQIVALAIMFMVPGIATWLPKWIYS